MSIPLIRPRTAVITAAGALLLAVLVAAPQASAATLYACAKKNGTARIFTKKPKCKKGETKLTWNTEGLPGRNGTNGINGNNGTNGTNGQNLTSQTPLASGKSESGFFATGSGESKAGFVGVGISFSQPLAAVIAENHVIYNVEKATSTHCPGPERADPGFVCMYQSEGGGNLAFLIARDFAIRENAADKYGFAAFFSVTAAGFVAGSWTVTAP